MSFSPTDSKIFAPIFREETTARIFPDENLVQLMLDFEATLAQVQGQLGIIPKTAAQQITAAAGTLQIDFDQLQIETERAGVPVLGLVKQLRQAAGEAADYVHWGATTQDVMDTAVVLQLRASLDHIEPILHQLITNLAQLADHHRHTLMAARTHSQQALPTTFGLKVAGWLAPLLRHRQRLAELKPRLLVVQFGGAAGTLASLSDEGIVVQTTLAQELGLGQPPIPWHTQRDNLAEMAGWLSLLCGSLAKMAQDIILLAQTEVGEIRETADTARGGSSTMPQKSNPIISEGIIAAARANANLLATMHQALVQEQERGTHGWQMEWLTLPQMVGLTAVALNKALFLSQNLAMNAARMQQNVAAANGLMLAEALNFALAQHMSRAEAKTLITGACQRALAEDRHLVDVVREELLHQAQGRLTLDWQTLRDEANYLGAAQTFIDNVLQETKSASPPAGRGLRGEEILP
ncbi:MAG: 3-carboxy-cis,cis-muconate cycloisomerase [Anaerolineae bacterium]|nr:3-carboxy-cis,cis-muconate cycloisomerase [Anaerolineae bacterium]